MNLSHKGKLNGHQRWMERGKWVGVRGDMGGNDNGQGGGHLWDKLEVWDRGRFWDGGI